MSQLKKAFGGKDEYESDSGSSEYLEVAPSEEGRAKVIIRSFVLDDFSGIKPILDAVREGYTIAFVNIQPLKDKDLGELKRSIDKLKKTIDAVGGEIAGFDEDWLVLAPSFAEIYKPSKEVPQEQTQAEAHQKK